MNMKKAPVILFEANSFETGKKFDGIGAVISSNEDKPTYDFLFQFVKDFSSILPAAVMADGSAAILASCKDVLPLSLRLIPHLQEGPGQVEGHQEHRQRRSQPDL